MKDVDAATGGKLKITPHFGASLFKMPEIKRAVQTGNAQMGELLVSFRTNRRSSARPAVSVSNYDEAYQALSGPEARTAKLLDKRAGAAVFGGMASPGHHKKPILCSRPQGHEWRVYSPTTARIGELIGAQPVTVQEAELSQALATGVVDGLGYLQRHGCRQQAV
ncbi:hypothetical protein J4714_13370 [Staphylococcus epidermidis]|nr:hypothetical protein [Staphylococcus epidermidis]